VHLHLGQQVEDLGHVLQARPVELDVLTRGDVAVAAVVGAGDVRQRAQLLRVQVAVGHGDAQHRRVALDVEAVLQAQRTELVLGQFAGEVAAGLVGELGNALIDDALIVFVVLVHVLSLVEGSRGGAGLRFFGPMRRDGAPIPGSAAIVEACLRAQKVFRVKL